MADGFGAPPESAMSAQVANEQVSTNIPPSVASENLAEKSVSLADQYLSTTKQFIALQQTMMHEAASFWGGVLSASTSATTDALDKRFSHESWHRDPPFDLMKRTYLAYSKILLDSVDHARVDDRTKKQLRFAVRQFVDAMSPTNFFATNPEAIQLAVETGGRSISEGMNLLMQDIARGRVSNNDETAFEIGKNVAVTPGAVIYENELIQLIQYSPTTSEVHKRPFIVVPPCINRFFVLDLQPDNSLVRYAVDQGHTVFIVSWRNISEELGHLTWDDYLHKGVIRAIDVVLAITGADKANTLGFCIGGTLLSCALAVLKARGEDKVSSMSLLASMLDFSDTGELGLMVNEQVIAAREAAIGKRGVVSGKDLGTLFSSLRANDLVWAYVVDGYLKGKTPPAFDMLFWNAQSANLSGPMFCWYLRNSYLENNFRVPGKTAHCGVPLDLSRIDCPTYIYASREDHIVPWRSAYQTRRLLSSPSTFVLGASGHIAGVINSAWRNKRNYWISNASLDASADEWFEQSVSEKGSWWLHWRCWLAQHAGEKVAARGTLGDANYCVVEPAPGRYVTEAV